MVTDRRLWPMSLEFDMNFTPVQAPMLHVTHPQVTLYLLGVGRALGPAFLCTVLHITEAPEPTLLTSCTLSLDASEERL